MTGQNDGGTRGDSPLSEPLITEVYYDTLVKNEFVVLSNPGIDHVDIGGWRLTDLEGILGFPQGAILPAKGRIIVTQNSTLYNRDTLRTPDFSIDGILSPAMIKRGGVFQLKNDGDEVVLEDSSGSTVDVFAFGYSKYNGSGWSGPPAMTVRKGHIALRESLGEVFVDTNSSADWDGMRVPVIGQSSLNPPVFEFDGTAQIIVSPVKALEKVSWILDSAQESLFLNLYEFTNDELALSILAAIQRGVDVRILMEGAPVGGIKQSELTILRELSTAGAAVHLMLDNSSDGVAARYRFDHAKYLVSDNLTILAGSENWGYNGFPSGAESGNRGWSARFDNAGLAKYMAGVFLQDWNPERSDIVDLQNAFIVPVPDEVSDPAGVPATFANESLTGHFKVTPMVGPDNSLDDNTIIGLLRSAETSLDIEQFYISRAWGGYSNLFLDETIAAARRGVDVRVLLDSSWYNIDENDAMNNDDVVAALKEIADAEGIPLAAKLANPLSHGLMKFHNKGIVVDDRKVLVSSLNWNLNSVTENREVGFIVENAELAGLLEEVFEHDWKDDVTSPVADAGRDLTVFKGEELILTSTGSRDDVGIVACRWDIDGDGSFEINGSVVSLRLNELGDHTITMVVEDAWGNSANDSVVVKVVERPHIPDAGGYELSWWPVIIIVLFAVAAISAFTMFRRK